MIISQLYKLEAHAQNKKFSPQARYQLRQEKGLPILTKFKVWLDDANDKIIAGSYIGKAIKYNINQWHKLVRYIDDAQASATLYSIVMTCRANDINPYYYFLHLFKTLPNRESGDDDFTHLMPWNVQLDFDHR
jgi:transposase